MKISKLKVETIVTETVTIDTIKIPAGVVITLESEHGLNKVIDAETPKIILYVGEWTVTSGNVTAEELRLIVPEFTVKEVDGEVVLVVTKL